MYFSFNTAWYSHNVENWYSLLVGKLAYLCLFKELLEMQVGNWSRWLTDMFGMDTEDLSEDGDVEPKSFVLLNDLSDLLMLPKEMLLDRQVRQEVNFMN